MGLTNLHSREVFTLQVLLQSIALLQLAHIAQDVESMCIRIPYLNRSLQVIITYSATAVMYLITGSNVRLCLGALPF